ncbi:hypothetical protein [Jongsikchunia kroppenstedtii]|uniref:hypothetical protein n=1 Tax=Jongsikchunia kroppenstedtii TaxID=1121721 RepID=UPI000360CB2F|nr:hypothetical protein [Jongsikchunia kroppenstedtii]
MTTASATPPASPGRRRHWWPLIGGVAVAVVVVLAVLGLAALLFGWKDGKSVNRTDIGMCITVSGSAPDDVHSHKTDCDNQSLNYYVTDKQASVADCKAANGFYATMSDSRSHQVLCLTPNMRVGSCYQDGDRVALRQVSCTTPSNGAAPVLRVTQRVAATTVPECGDPDTQQVRVFGDAPDGPIGYCVSIQGDLTFTRPD